MPRSSATILDVDAPAYRNQLLAVARAPVDPGQVDTEAAGRHTAAAAGGMLALVGLSEVTAVGQKHRGALADIP